MQSSIKSIRTLISAMKQLGYVIYDKPYKLNIVGVRSDSVDSNKFDDFIYVFWKDEENQWVGKYYEATTDPGTYYLKNPLSKLGTAILKQGQYVDAYSKGKHKGQYNALVQTKPVTVLRDYDRNAVLDFMNGKPETGLFGINLHKSGSNSVNVDQWSAGCQVFKREADFNEFMKLVDKDASLNGGKFTYTLIDERAYRRTMLKRGLLIAGAVLAVGAISFAVAVNLKKIPKISF